MELGKVTTEMYQLGIFTGVELKANHWNSGETFWKIRGFITMSSGEFIIAR
jgi:hypothetical protein